MEYCPEIAVFQSAFQLIAQQVGQGLSVIPKERCEGSVKVIVAAVEEICFGLESDLDRKDALLWKQKLHAVVLYVLVQNKYRDSKEVVSAGKVAVCNVIDMLVQLLPVYSASFYFELVKQLNWIPLLLQSLQCIDYKTSARLLDDLLSHCRSEPLTLKDTEMISMVTENLLSRCLCVPDTPDDITVGLLKPLTQEQKFIQTIYTEEIDSNVAMVTKGSGPSLSRNRNNYLFEKIGSCFWDRYIEDKPAIFDMVIDFYTSNIKKLTHDSQREVQLMRTCSQIGLWWYLIQVCKDNNITDKWLVNNLFVPDTKWKLDYTVDQYSVELVYSINYTLLQSLFQTGSNATLMQTVQRSVAQVLLLQAKNQQADDVFVTMNRKTKSESETAPKSDNNPKSNTGPKSNKNRGNVEVVSGLTVHDAVLMRMLAGMLRSGLDMEGGLIKVEQILTGQTEVDGTEQDGVVVFGETWCDDVTLDSLLWRIDNRLPLYQVCVDRLLGQRCLKFWQTERIFSVLSKHSSLLATVDRIHALILLLKTVEEYQSGDITHHIVSLITAAFSELSFPDQDKVITQLYSSEQNHVTKYYNKDIGRKITNVFNKITADIDNQVMSKISLLCLGDPVLVLRTVVHQCVRNDQQAINCANIAQQLASLCTCHHPVKHLDMSLIALVIQEFLTAQPLAEKEQQCFQAFVSILMKSKPNTTVPVLSPGEFLHTSVLPSLSVAILRDPQSTVSCLFVVNLLSAALTAGCDNSCDWSEYEFEPMALVLTLAELKHECVVLWEVRQQNEENVIVAMESEVAIVPGTTKLVVKEGVNACLSKMCSMVLEGIFKIQERDREWLVQTTQDLHWSVQLGLCPFMTACGLQQYREAWLQCLTGLLEDPGDRLLVLLQFAAADSMYVEHILERWPAGTVVNKEDMIHGLVQVFPQCVMTECENIVVLIEGLLAREDHTLAVTYRFRSTCNLPLLDLSGLRRGLYTSQLLGDVILTLMMTLTSVEEESRSMLYHAVQCYVYLMQKRIDLVEKNRELKLLYLSELFHHVCEVTLNLPTDIMDSTLVFLLHIASKFKAVVKATQKGDKVKVDLTGLKLVKNLENRLCCAVQGLPESCEEKQMLMKKTPES